MESVQSKHGPEEMLVAVRAYQILANGENNQMAAVLNISMRPREAY